MLNHTPVAVAAHSFVLASVSGACGFLTAQQWILTTPSVAIIDTVRHSLRELSDCAGLIELKRSVCFLRFLLFAVANGVYEV